MRRAIVISCGFILLAALTACARDPRARNPVEDPREAAVRGDASAQFEMGLRIMNGQGVPPDYADAAAWFRRAAEQGDPGAQAALGFMYHKGFGVKRDDGEAFKWLDLAARGQSADRDAYALWRDYVARR